MGVNAPRPFERNPRQGGSQNKRLSFPLGKRNFTSKYGATMRVAGGRGGNRVIVTLPSGTQTIFAWRRTNVKVKTSNFVLVIELPERNKNANPTRMKPYKLPVEDDLVVLRQFKGILINRFKWTEDRFL